MINKNYWCKYDFEVNKHLWMRKGIEKAESIRKNNIIDLTLILRDLSVPFWLQGKTLLGAFTYGKLLIDHDDDIGVDYRYKHIIEVDLAKRLELIGFERIRETDSIISYIRGDRYIDICLFKSMNGKYGYLGKWFPKHFFDHLDEIQFFGLNMPIPNNTKDLLSIMYDNKRSLYLNKLINLVMSPSKYLFFLRKVVDKFLNSVPHNIKRSTAWLFSPFGISYRKISFDEFNDLMFEAKDSFNWKWRKPHLDIITNNKKSIKIKEIMSYIDNVNKLDDLVLKVNETDTSSVFYTPHNFDPKFWQSGNNYFIYNIKYQFRRGVVQYSDANQYIKDEKKPMLYTSEYYESLDLMNDLDIKKLTYKYPIEISNGAVTSGKHRVAAMIGRVLSEKKYIPLWAIVKEYKDS